MRNGNLLAGLPTGRAEEQIERLAGGSKVRIERIVVEGNANMTSTGFAHPVRN